MKVKKDTEAFTIHFPKPLLAALRQRASILNRSTNAEIQTLVEAALRAEADRDLAAATTLQASRPGQT